MQGGLHTTPAASTPACSRICCESCLLRHLSLRRTSFRRKDSAPHEGSSTSSATGFLRLQLQRLLTTLAGRRNVRPPRLADRLNQLDAASRRHRRKSAASAHALTCLLLSPVAPPRRMSQSPSLAARSRRTQRPAPSSCGLDREGHEAGSQCCRSVPPYVSRLLLSQHRARRRVAWTVSEPLLPPRLSVTRPRSLPAAPFVGSLAHRTLAVSRRRGGWARRRSETETPPSTTSLKACFLSL